MTLQANRYRENELLSTAAWLTLTTLEISPDAIEVGRQLNEALVRQRLIRDTATLDDKKLAEVQQQLDLLRTSVRENASRWKLRSAKTTLRGYRELSSAAFQ